MNIKTWFDKFVWGDKPQKEYKQFVGRPDNRHFVDKVKAEETDGWVCIKIAEWYVDEDLHCTVKYERLKNLTV